MKISFKKKKGNPSLGIAFFWMMQIDVDSPISISDNFIPELFYDYFLIQTGGVSYKDAEQSIKNPLPQQALKTIYTQSLNFNLTMPLILFGARLSLTYAESFLRNNLVSNSLIAANWVQYPVNSLENFASQITATIQKHQVSKTPPLLLWPTLEESDWLAHFSPRHKRRLYKSVFGISRKEMLAIQNVHSFLGNTCDFSSQNPRIIEHINSTFYDQPHLNHAFKKMTGLSPLEHFQANSILQDNLMAASYNEYPD